MNKDTKCCLSEYLTAVIPVAYMTLIRGTVLTCPCLLWATHAVCLTTHSFTNSADATNKRKGWRSANGVERCDRRIVGVDLQIGIWVHHYHLTSVNLCDLCKV